MDKPTPQVTSSHNPHSQIETSINTAYGLGAEQILITIFVRWLKLFIYCVLVVPLSIDRDIFVILVSLTYILSSGTIREIATSSGEESVHMNSNMGYRTTGEVQTSRQVVREFEIAVREDSFHMNINTAYSTTGVVETLV